MAGLPVATMPLEGELRVRLSWNGSRVQEVTINATRPLAAAGLFAGKSPAWVVATVPMLFSICASAQGAAAGSAVAAAGGADDALRPMRELEVIIETIREHFWRLLIDWPQSMGREAVLAPMACVRRLAAAPRAALTSMEVPARRELADALGTAAAESIYGMTPSEWLAIDDLSRLHAWTDLGVTLPAMLLGQLLKEMPRLGTSDVPLMPPISAQTLVDVVAPEMRLSPGFARAPTWNGTPVETGVLARMQSQPLLTAVAARCGNAVATRMVARLVELALLLEEFAGVAAPTRRLEAFSLGGGEGVAAVQTARGLLLHRARLRNGSVADYQIVAPTEWNFHPQGAFPRALLALEADDDASLEWKARLTAQALDPCVACRIEVGHA
ncbi:MAG TPA: nickel-dependent hydrogenase large subunit [Casimicrobiaceae bacterium]|nr:nickel-dependent hydrogenase large subunit [Casimicrobiaceae bacterium]